MNYKLVAIIVAFLVGLYFCLMYKSKDAKETRKSAGAAKDKAEKVKKKASDIEASS